ncbi:hypothetical protein DRN46_05750 [Thermococci archaeon]|nr:MAG: hypothetical protein DRN46_05750 [Thermococci archaeon]RLF97086.1 MAG: hypothetical protein DRN52_01240 [Thermococci archaeon]
MAVYFPRFSEKGAFFSQIPRVFNGKCIKTYWTEYLWGRELSKEAEILDILSERINSLRLKKAEVEIYKLLSRNKRGMTVTEIAKELNLSTRTVRDKVRRLHEMRLLEREIVENKWIGYVYRAVNYNKAIKVIKEKLEKVVKEIETVVERKIDRH